MKKIFSLTISILFLIFACTACSTQPQIELNAETTNREVVLGDTFVVRVYTKNVGDDYHYRGSSTKIGAGARIFIQTDVGEQYLDHDPIAVSDDVADNVFAHGELIEYDWIFHTDGQETLTGTYHLSLTFLDEEKVISDFITIIDN
ncbi:MAG: hypothetical protein K2L87_04900 [Clostridiales bacterium]|nr:hypothetical protein [Clostridiales bacterium]